MKTMLSSLLFSLIMLCTNGLSLTFYANYSNCRDENPQYVISNIKTDCGYNFILTNDCQRRESALTFMNNTHKGIHLQLHPELGHILEYNNITNSIPKRVSKTKTIYIPYNSTITVQAADNYFYKRKDVRFGMTCR